MNRKFLFLILISLTVLSCSDCLDKWNSKHLVYDFYLEWQHQPKSQHISIGSWNCGVGGNEIITRNAIYAVGYDSNFIIAKLHPDKAPVIKERLFTDTNSRGDYSLLFPSDTQYLDDEKELYHDSIYQENGKWYHTRKEWYGSSDSLYIDKAKTIYYIINTKNYPAKWQTKERVTTYNDEKSFLNARQALGVSPRLEFTIVTKELD